MRTKLMGRICLPSGISLASLTLLLACSGESGTRDTATTTASGGSITTTTSATQTTTTTDGTDSATTDDSSSGTGNSTSNSGGTTTTTSDGTTGDPTATTSGGPKFDVGTELDLPGAGDAGDVGCQKIDFLFVVDNSGSMGDEQMSLATSFPGFIDAIQNTVMAQDYHIMVIDTDAGGGGGGSLICSPDPACCVDWCNANPSWSCNGNPCTPPNPGTCDDILGAGKTVSQANADCGITSGQRYMLDDQPNLSTTFECLALVGTSGDGTERPMEAMVEAVTTLNPVGECNENFLRDDAILVVTFITDEEDANKSAGNPATWKADLVAAKNGDENAVVVLGLIGDNNVPNGVCGVMGDADDAPNLRMFAESFMYGSWGSVCALDYAPFFTDAVSVVDSACDDFKPPG